MKKIFYALAFTLFLSMFFMSCYYDHEETLYITPPGQQNGICDTVNVTYSNVVKPIFDSYCNSCHSSGATFNFNGYSPLSAYLAGNSQRLIDNIKYTGLKPMPPSSKLNNCYIKQIEIWIQAGYPNN